MTAGGVGLTLYPGCAEIVAGKLYGLGGTVRNEGRVSWVAEGQGGWLPLNCYLLRSDEAAMLVDTGPACHREQILMQLRGLIGPSTPLSIFLTRAEADCIGNLSAIVRAFNVEHVYSGGKQNPFDFIDDALEHMMEEASDEDVVHTLSGMQLERRQDGEAIEIGAGRRVHVHAAPLRILTTFWLYDEATKALFSSDFYSHNMVVGDMSSKVIDEPIAEAEVPLRVEQARAHLYTKFEWMRLAGNRLLRDKLDTVLSRREISVLAPTHGCVVKGEDAVAQQLDLVAAAFGDDPA